ncbi:MAG: ROK family protein, partial [Bacteroidales bacterium]
VLGNNNTEISKRSRLNVGEVKEAKAIRRKLEPVLRDFLESDRIESIGVGFGGPVNYQEGTIAVSHQVKGWSGFNLVEWLENLSGLPVQVDNDANTAALAEAHLGSGKTYDKVSYVTLGSGVGGGYIMNGEIYHGVEPGESEIGQLRYDKTGTTFESLCSGWAVDKKARNYISTNPDSKLTELVGESTHSEAAFITRAVQKGDAGAKAILEETADDLAFGLSHVVHLFHPEMIILGGGLSLMGEPLRKSVASNLPRFVMKAFYPGPKVSIAKLGEDVVSIGALLLAQKIFT